MSNSITLATNYTDLLDEEFKKDSVTAQLSGDPAFVRVSADAKTIYYPQMTTGGLGDYSRETGYPDGGVSLVWKYAEFNYDRGTRIMVDAMDDQETFNLAFGMAGRELQRTRVAPEADAFTFATLAGLQDVQTPTAANLSGARGNGCRSKKWYTRNRPQCTTPSPFPAVSSTMCVSIDLTKTKLEQEAPGEGVLLSSWRISRRCS